MFVATLRYSVSDMRLDTVISFSEKANGSVVCFFYKKLRNFFEKFHKKSGLKKEGE